MDNDITDEKHADKLYIGNLDFRVTEYNVIKLLSPYGKILSVEYMWHTHGPKRGEPRGFAFVEFNKREEAVKAKRNLNGKLAFGRPLVVHFVDEKMVCVEKPLPDTNLLPQPSASLLPNALESRSAKIAAIKNKLWAMEQEDPNKSEAERAKRVKSLRGSV